MALQSSAKNGSQKALIQADWNRAIHLIDRVGNRIRKKPMGLSSKAVTLTSALVGCAVFSQAPEFAQQYRQRIGGAVDELKTVVTDFDKDAAGSEMSRGEALSALLDSAEKFTHERGLSMGRNVERFSQLEKTAKNDRKTPTRLCARWW